MARLSWEDSGGHLRTAGAKSINRSKSGLLIEASDPIETRTFVQVQTERREIAGTACVRHCVRKGPRCVVGLEFALDVRWRDEPEQAAADG